MELSIKVERDLNSFCVKKKLTKKLDQKKKAFKKLIFI